MNSNTSTTLSADEQAALLEQMEQTQEEVDPLEQELIDDAALIALTANDLPYVNNSCRAPELVSVVDVIDGDTIRVQGISSNFTGSVRLIGVDTPELDRDGFDHECYGVDALNFTSLLKGHVVWLTFDERCEDFYDRNLAYVYVGAGLDGLWQRELLKRGFATTLFVENRAYENLLKQDELEAQTASIGLWSSCAQ